MLSLIQLLNNVNDRAEISSGNILICSFNVPKIKAFSGHLAGIQGP